MLKWIVVWMCLPVSVVLATPKVSADLMRRVDAVTRAQMQQQKAPGVAIGIIRDGEVIAAKGYGYSNLEHRVAVTPETIFQSGSVGKQFTAVAVMLQVEDGKLALDDSITKYFTDAPPSWRRITVRHLLTHTSGIPDYETQVTTASDGPRLIDYRHDYTEEELTKIAYGLPLQFEPGSRWRYSNTGYVLLGILIHKVSGRFYGDVLHDRVFTPLGMKTARVITEEDIVPNRAAGYRLKNGEIKNQEWVAPGFNTTADGALYLSMNDFIAWDRGLRRGAILKPQSWAQIYTPVSLTSGKTYPYGFGWRIDESKGKPWYHHSGEWQGFKTCISRYLADGLTVVVLVNLADADPERFVDGIAMALDPELAELEPSKPLADADPAVTARLRAVLKAADGGTLAASELKFALDDPEQQAAYFEKLLRPLGAPKNINLVEQRQLGDDRVFTYVVAYHDHAVRVRFGVAPDNRIAEFNVEPQ